MANTSVAIKDATGATVNVDAFSVPDGDSRQAVVLGSAATADTATIGTDGSVLTREVAPTTATRTTWTCSTTAAVLLSASTTRQGFSIYNGSANNVFIGFGTTNPTAIAFTVKMIPDTFYETPFRYRGEVRAVAAAGGGTVQVTELT